MQNQGLRRHNKQADNKCYIKLTKYPTMYLYFEKSPYWASLVRNQGQMKSKVMCVWCNLVLAVTRDSFS